MKITDGYLVRDIAGTCVAIPVGQNIVDYKGMLQINEVGAFILNCLETECTYEELIEKLRVEYQFEEHEIGQLKLDTERFLESAKAHGVIQ